MLQPRLLVLGCGSGKMGSVRNTYFQSMRICFIVTAVILSSTFVSCQELNKETIEASRIKRESVSENRDLTVLLVNDKNGNDYNSRIGRYHSVKPVIGLLTSTARTFIQDGVTTEFATQILGTTLDNGRIYAQLLTKSSLVLYSKPTNIDEPLFVKPTKVPSVFDEQWNVKEDLGFIDPDKYIPKNIDYLAPSSKMKIVYASKTPQENIKYWSSPSLAGDHIENQIFDEPTARKVQSSNEILRDVQNEVFNQLDGPTVDSVNNVELTVQPPRSNNVNGVYRQNKAYDVVPETVKIDSQINEDVVQESNVSKVRPDYDVPTFTIKNEFSPIFYYIDNVESQRVQQVTEPTKLPKKMFGQNPEPRPKTTFTYAGFADFTTIVGDTVIIFTPNTETVRQPSPNEVNIFPSVKKANDLGTKITFLSADIPGATSTFKAHDVSSATQTLTAATEKQETETPFYVNEENLKNVKYEPSAHIANGFAVNFDVIQPSEAAITTTESTRVSDSLEILPIQENSFQATDPLVTLNPTAIILETPKHSIVTESKDFFTNSEEESDNIGAEVTEGVEGEDEGEDEVISQNNEREEKETTDLITTTESGHSEESIEDEIESTTESKFDIHEELVCSEGLETQTTMTTEYKTLTYLTTYFIPLESTETTTSVKSDVVVESNIGYLTNVLCKSHYDIQPTEVSSLNIQPTEVLSVSIEPTEHLSVSIQSSVSSTENQGDTHESLTEPPTSLEITTENESKAPEIEKHELHAVQLDHNNTTVDTVKVNELGEKHQEEQHRILTTTESAPTSQSHVEVSVSTDHSTTTEKQVTEAQEDNSQENEIDVIYKTLYTTYTYFTTFFGDQTSSVASHKVVETNVITSTIDLNNLDPSLLGVLGEEDDIIAPTNVGIGRPTESFAQNSISNLFKNKFLIESVEQDDIYSSQTPTPSLGDDVMADIKPDVVKTFFTTYTFFTTIYVGTDANVCSRSEIYTNYVGPQELIPTKSLKSENTLAQYDFRNCKQVKLESPENQSGLESEAFNAKKTSDNNKSADDEIKTETAPQPTSVEVDMLFSVDSNPVENENLYVTDVTSSSSKGERKFLDSNNILEDQISSESNIEEIMPSPTLLLQTSYTTFTYFTTMYIGKDSSKVKSRLETITNVVTETITPNKDPEEESTLPITYYTTFTYWTTLSKDNSTTITSREEIVSNVVTPTIQTFATVSPIDTTPIDIDNIVAPKDLEVQLKPSLIGEGLDHDDGKATFYTTYTYFTTFYVGNTSQIRSSLETVTNIIDNTKSIEDNQLGRKIPSGSPDKNLLKDNVKPHISPTSIKEQIKPTKLPDISSPPPTVLLGTYIDNLFAEVKPNDNSIPTSEAPKKILFSQVAVISGDSTIVTKDNKTINNLPTTTTNNSTNTTTTTTSTTTTPDTTTNSEKPAVTLAPEVIESSVAEPDATTVTNQVPITEDDVSNNKKKSRLTYTPKKPSYTPVIIPFASRNRPTFSPKRVPLLSSATTITRADSTPTITATPTLKSVRTSGFSSSRKQPKQPQPQSISPAGTGRRFSGRNTVSSLSSNLPIASRSSGLSSRANIQPSSRRTGFRSSTLKSNSFDYASRSAVAAKIRPTASSRLRNSKQSASVTLPPSDTNESETTATQLEENTTDSSDEVTEPTSVTTSNPLSRFRRPNVPRLPGTAILPRTTPPTKKGPTARLRTTTTRRITTRSINPLLSLRRDRPNSLFPRRNLFRQPEAAPIEEVKEDEPAAEEEELLETEEFDEDNEYDASNRKEEQVSVPSAPISRKSTNSVQIRPFRRRVKRQSDYGSRKYPSFRRPGTINTRRTDPTPEAETEKTPVSSTTKPKTGRISSRTKTTKAPKTTPAPAAPKVSSRQPFIVRGAQTTTTSAPAYRRNSSSRSKTTPRTTVTRPKTSKTGSSRNTQTGSGSSRSSKSRSRTTTTGRTSGRNRGSFENTSGERFNFNNILNDGKVTVTHHIPLEITVPTVNGKITQYKNLLTETTSVETLLRNQVSTSLGLLGNQQLIIATESTELADNGATKIIKFLLHETPTSTIIFTPTTIRGRKTSYSHILPSTVYNVEAVTQTIAPEINSNLPLANLLLSQLLLGGNQQPGINPLLALQGQSLFPQQPVAQTPVTEYITKTNTFVTTVTDARETVLPITFRGKAILTTIIDPTTSVITATEFVTDTVVTTPTVFGQAAATPQLNSLLLPLLLQQQQQQQQKQPLLNLPLQTANPLLALMPELGLDPTLDNFSNDIYSNSPKPNVLLDLISNEELPVDEPLDVEMEEEIPSPPPPPSPAIHPSPAFLRGRARTKAAAKLPPANNPIPPLPSSFPGPPSPPAAAKITSVVTLYVSGRYPGEFSTVLSTVVSEDTQIVRKREANYYEDIQLLPSVLPTYGEIISSQADNIIEDSILVGSEKYWDDSPAETQSLESIVGELSQHIKYDASPTYVVKLAKPSVIRDLKQSLVDDIS